MSHAEQAVKIPVTERMVSPSPVARGAPESPPYLMAALVSLGALILYGITLAPTTQFWDTSEYIAAAYSLGIPHPPGNPLFTLIAHVWGLLPLAAGYAMRINLLAAVTSAVAAGPPSHRRDTRRTPARGCAGCSRTRGLPRGARCRPACPAGERPGAPALHPPNMARGRAGPRSFPSTLKNKWAARPTDL